MTVQRSDLLAIRPVPQSDRVVKGTASQPLATRPERQPVHIPRMSLEDQDVFAGVGVQPTLRSPCSDCFVIRSTRDSFSIGTKHRTPYGVGTTFGDYL